MAIAPIRRFRVIENRQEAEETFVLVMEPADGEPMFSFQAGQFVMLHILDADGASVGRAAFTIASAPVESSEKIELGIKVYGQFTTRAKTLNVGEIVGIQGPYGRFVLEKDAEPLVLFAGGIGITPFRCMIREILLSGLKTNVILFYSDRSMATMAYEKELRELATTHKNLRVNFLFTRDKVDPSIGECGRLNAEIVSRELTFPPTAVYCMCGPDPFMECVKSILISNGVDVKTALKQEVF
jgi:ferredoxin-NADP reductase